MLQRRPRVLQLRPSTAQTNKQIQGKTTTTAKKKKKKKALAVGVGLRLRTLAARKGPEWAGQAQGLGSAWLEGASECARSGLGLQQAPQGLSGQGKCWPHSLPIPQGLSLSPLIPSLWVGPSPPLPQLPLRGTGSVSPPLLLPSPSPPRPTQSLGSSSRPLRCPRSPTSAW